ncbi:MAG: ATP-grasp domain-containing protein, partial [Planctomycetes bacterium]|nr:ATP-grasp domain-containing protein [Planctomycetota bacterium]
QPLTSVLIGASTRALAFTARSAGWSPWCVDLFADRDLLANAPVTKIPFEDYPQKIPELLADAPDGPVIYTGGLENHPKVIEQIAARRTLWGNGPASLGFCRDPFYLARIWREAGLRHPAVFTVPSTHHEMLRKPLRGAGGANIHLANHDDPPVNGYYFQQFISGPSYAAIYCVFADHTLLLGVTEQIVGEPRLNAKPFHYAGSVGPITFPDATIETVRKLGETARIGCGLRGLFGIDFILHDSHPWPVEINPRYTASVEVLEHALGFRSLEYHRAAFTNEAIPAIPTVAKRCVGKAIVFAQQSFRFSDLDPGKYGTAPWTLPEIADVPHAGEMIEAGWPVLTVFAEGKSPDACRDEVIQRAERRKPPGDTV